MLITFDNAAEIGSASPGTSITGSFTVGTGTNRLLVVSVRTGGNDTITGVTYGGVAMTKAVSVANAGNNCRVYIYYLVNPATGANNVVVSSSASDFIRAVASSYAGGKQSGQPDGTNTAISNSATTITTTITTTADKCWNISAVANDGNLAMTNSTGVTSNRAQSANVLYLGDSNGEKTPAGSYGMTWTCGAQAIAAAQISIAPAVDSGGFFLFM